MKTFGACIGVLVSVLALTWIFQGNDFFLYKVFAPQYEQTRRQVFEQTKSYRQGMIQDMSNFQQEYITASSEQKKMLANVALHRFADFPEADLPANLRAFMNELRQTTER